MSPWRTLKECWRYVPTVAEKPQLAVGSVGNLSHYRRPLQSAREDNPARRQPPGRGAQLRERDGDRSDRLPAPAVVGAVAGLRGADPGHDARRRARDPVHLLPVLTRG